MRCSSNRGSLGQLPLGLGLLLNLGYELLAVARQIIDARIRRVELTLLLLHARESLGIMAN